jgi:hypothetical protein
LPTRRLTRVQTLILPSIILLLLSAGIRADQETRREPPEWGQQLERLRAVPYVGLSEEPVDESQFGVMLYDPEKACNGYNLYCNRLSGDAFLLEMNGDVAHHWTFSPAGKEDSEPAIQLDDYAVMLENGDLIVQKKFMEVLRINWNSKLLWQKKLDTHHDVVPAPDGSFYVIIRDFKVHRDLHVRFPVIVHLSPDGEELDRWSVHDHLAEIIRVFDTRSFLDTVLDRFQAGVKLDSGIRGKINAARSGRQIYDYFHMNTISVLPDTPLGQRDSRFQQGNLLICFRNVNQIAVLEKDIYRVLWAWGEGELEWPHHPTMLENSHILIFDNGVKRKYSRVVELNPEAGAIVWEYKAEPPEDFFSRTRGSAQRLPNGNTLICDSNSGRTFQVTTEGEMVWEWLNPSIDAVYRGRPHRETVYRMLYYPPEVVDPLLRRWWWVE